LRAGADGGTDMAIEIKEGKYEYDTETEKLAPTHEELMHWFLWVNEHASEFEEKYPGKYLAIWDYEIIGVGEGTEVYEEAQRRRPDVIPYIVYVPIEEEAVLLV
jgi:hypothetical protein